MCGGLTEFTQSSIGILELMDKLIIDFKQSYLK